ncbi:MAG: hypothetical protein DI603_10380 [Roseateles depolymerans]|uniref:Uncharacterized protein n=1 Tax=Roseateles depolymerans TaxID=76731 RepID=A0A2W5DNX5_9BURK|nr:MAG: hypothetical protein DI603_10380 [Roseateles depolymerans]
MSGGKYGEEVDKLMESLEASSVLLAVVNGIYGTRFSLQGSPEIVAAMPTALRLLADQIEAGSAKVDRLLS